MTSKLDIMVAKKPSLCQTMKDGSPTNQNVTIRNLQPQDKPSLRQTVKDGSPTNPNVTTRNLQPQDLGGVIFGCTNYTFAECHERQLFGLPITHCSYVKNIKIGLPLFLFNYDDRKLHGIYEAASNGKFCPLSDAWSRNGKKKTNYPAQVAMRSKVWCFPLAERQFRNAILTNYYERLPGVSHFYFELDHAQTHALINMFTPLPAPCNFWTPHITTPVHEHVRPSTLPPVCEPEFEGNSDVKSEKVVKPHAAVDNVGANTEHATSNYECSSGFNNLDYRETLSGGRDYALSSKDAKMQQLQSGQQDKKVSVVKLGKFKAQKVKRTILDGPYNLPKKIDAKVDQVSLGHSNLPVQSLDYKYCTEAKMNAGCTVINKLSSPPPAMTQQFQESEAQQMLPVYETPKDYKNNNGAPKSTDSAGHPLSHCAEPTSIRPLTIPTSQECIKVENSLGRKRKTRCPNNHDETHNVHPTEIPSPDYTICYVKDGLIKKIACMVCGEEGHYTCDCPLKDQENKVMCTICNKVGHCYLWCCREHVSENRACRRCGEKGHYTNKDLQVNVSENRACRRCGEKGHHCYEKYTNMYVRCSSCDESHPLGRCPMGEVTCFLCEGKGHVPAQCRFSPMLTVTQHYRESFQAILKQSLTETSRRAVTPAMLSSELERHDDSHEHQLKRNDRMVHMVPSISHYEQGDCEKNNTRSVPDSDGMNHAASTKKALSRGSSSVCFNCREEGHYANSCPKKLLGEVELGDVTCSRFRAKKCHKKKSAKFEQSDATCFICHDKGHYSYSCPANKPPGGLELRDITCNTFDANSCDWKKSSRELLCDITTCFICHDRGHYSYNCPKSKPPGQGQNAKSCPKKKRKKEQQK